MNGIHLPSLCKFAEARGLQKASVIEVLIALQSMKRYRCPRTKIESVKYPRQSLSWMQMDDILKTVLRRKDAISSLFERAGIKADIVIGGSMSLKYQGLTDRAFSDIDFIVHAYNAQDKEALKKFMLLLTNAGAAKNCAAYYPMKSSSFMMGSIRLCGKDHPINILISNEYAGPFSSNVFNSPCEVVNAKMQYYKKGCRRGKDLIDLYRIFYNK